MRKASSCFDDLCGHLQAIHFHGQPLQPPKASLERLDWREEERRKGHDDDSKEWKRTRREEKRLRSPHKTSPRKAARWDSPAAPSLGSLGEIPGVLLSPLPTSLVKKGKSKSPWKPTATVSRAPEETMEITWEEPTPATERASPEPTPGPSRLDTTVSLPVDPEVSEDLPPRAVTLQDVRDYLAAAGEDERATIGADLMPDTR